MPYGITHPQPPRFVDAFDFDLGNVHEAENQLFHATFSGSLRELYAGGAMEEQEKLLYPQERPGERPECWAPAVFPTAEGYGMLYSPEVMHYADSADLYRFTPRAALFSGCAGMRDPFVFSEDGVYHILYNDGEVLWRRTTTDFQTVSAPQLLQHNGFGKEVAMESPSLIRRGGMYYLLWCVCDGQNGCYDNRTYVFAAPSLDELDGKAPLTVLRGHAPELVCDADGQVVYRERVLSRKRPVPCADTLGGCLCGSLRSIRRKPRVSPLSVPSISDFPATVRTMRLPLCGRLPIAEQVDAGILRLAPGVYRIKNTDFLPVSGRRDFVIDGCGAEMISATSFFFGVTDCERVTLQNLTIDVDWQVMRPANLVRLLSRSGQELELEFLDEDCPPLDLDIRSFNPVDPDRLTPGVPGDAEIWLGSGDIPARRRGAAENRIVLTCTAPAVSALRPGGLYILRRIRKRCGAAFYIEDSRHITMRDNTVYGTFGMVHLVNGHSHHPAV